MRFRIKMGAWAVVGGLSLLLSGASTAPAQDAATAVDEILSRPLMSERFYNTGIHGGFYGVGQNTLLYLAYPNYGEMVGGGGGAYGDTRLRDSGSQNRQASRWQQRLGHGVWTLTQDQKVIYTGLRLDAQKDNIRPMQYDVSADPDLSRLGTQIYRHRRPAVKLGYGTGFSRGYEETSLGGNWWPGSTLIADQRNAQPYARDPVHIMNFNLSRYPTDDTWPEEIIVTKWTNAQGLTITERVSGWSHPDFDDFFIDEYVIENTGDTNGDGKRDLPAAAQNALYIGFEDRFNLSATGQQFIYQYWYREHDRGMDDWYKYDAGLKLLYAFDGDEPRYASWNDTGDPYKDAFAAGTISQGGKIGQTENMLMSFAHLGVAPIAYTNAPASPYAFNARDGGRGYVEPGGEQPYALHYWEVFDTNVQTDPSLRQQTAAKIHSQIVGAGRRIAPDPARPSGQMSLVVFGPYDLPPDGKAKIVLAYVAGHPGQVLGNTDPITWARKGNQAELSKGLDALKQNLEAAQFAYDNAFDLPDAPPDVNFRTGSDSFAQMTVDWPAEIEQASHPDYAGADAKDIAGYRVYRSTWFDVGPWELIADIPAGAANRVTANYRVTREGDVYSFTDLSSAAGFFYHYSVRAYARGHSTWLPGNPNSPLGMAKLPSHIAQRVQAGQEGGWSAMTQRIYADESPYSVPSPQTEALGQRVRVVPNPYIVDSQHAYPGSTKIRFVGIPSKCRIRIYTVSGDLASDFIHNEATKGEHDYDQQTWVFNGEIASGVYLFVVENLLQGPSFGKTQRGAFMVIK